MAGKKEIDKVFFRMEWWLYLKWKQPLLRDEVLTRFFNHCAGMELIDLQAISANPSEAEQLLIPMVMQYEQDKTMYQLKCEKNSANAKRKYELQATASDRIQSQATASEETLSLPIEMKGKEKKGNERDYSLSAREETSPREEREELLRSLTFFFLTEGVLNPYTTAERAISHNESMGWQTKTEKGLIYDHSRDKLKFAQGWQCERNRYNLNDAQLFADFCNATGLRCLDIIDDYRGTAYESTVTFLFQKAKTVNAFGSLFRSDKGMLARGLAFVRERSPKSNGFSADLFKNI